ncbi:MAG TPA: ESX secretion-associated protein EspG [Pseudonocardia sp.]
MITGRMPAGPPTTGRATPDWSRATVFSAAAFEACWEILGLGETPWQLEPPRHGSTAIARRAFVAEVRARLQASGADLPAKLRLLAGPAWAVDVRLRSNYVGAALTASRGKDGGVVAGLAACRGRHGVLAVRHRDEIALVEVPAADAVAAVLSLLGPVRPGKGPPMLITTGPDPISAPLLAACRDVRLFGQLGASVAARDGRQLRRSRVIGFHRTDAGDYRSVRVDSSTIALEPATSARLWADLDGLLAVDRERYSGFAGRGST